MTAGQGDTSSKVRRVRIRVRGRVQGVAYRAATRHEARRLGLDGWVRNLPDGSVEAEAQGDPETVAALITWCHDGPSLARVTGVDVEELPPATGPAAERGFEIRR